MQHSEDLLYNGKVLLYAQNHTSYQDFPQEEEAFLLRQRTLLREVWLRCFYGKDFPGALMVRHLSSLR